MINLKDLYPFTLDDFQQSAIAALEEGKSVVVCAPTGSGKTLIGEYGIYRALANGKRVFYTTPLKALSNQKFRDFQEKFGNPERGRIPPEVGLITGDILVNPGAPIIVMTTEIFRNMLYETPIGEVGTSLENVQTVVLDECHYISDRDRGTVWEESIIYCPPNIQLVALSATIGNPDELTDWINQVRLAAQKNLTDTISLCELINSHYRPVPLRFYFINKEGLFPLLNDKQTKINPRLQSKGDRGKAKGKRTKWEDCPRIVTIIRQLQEKDMLPAIYVIFSRRGCDLAIRELDDLSLVNESEAKVLQYNLLWFFLAENIDLQEKVLVLFRQENFNLYEKVLAFLANQPEGTANLLQYLWDFPAEKKQLFKFLADNSHLARAEQLEPLTRGIAAHHAGILPAWKELVEKLFERGLVKIVFATSTLSAGINMPARTTVISALSKRTDEGHSLLTPSEFLQIAGRAGRRGMDEIGHVITVQAPFDGAKEAAFLATAEPEPLKSCFAPSYGMVLNLLQKHTIEQAKELLERSFAEYLSQLRLEPEKQAIGDLTTEISRLDLELAGIENSEVISYEKLKARLKQEEYLLKIVQQQIETTTRQETASQLGELSAGRVIHLKGKHIKVSSPLAAVFVSLIPSSGQFPDLLCLGEDNRWYIASNSDVFQINPSSLPSSELEKLSLPNLESFYEGIPRKNARYGWRKGDETSLVVSQKLPDYTTPLSVAPEILKQQQRLAKVEMALEKHPLEQRKNSGRLIKLHYHRLALREQLHKRQIRYKKQQSSKSYYWEEFLNLIAILREFNALDGYTPTPLGQAAATLRGENELWLGLVLMSGELDYLSPPHFAAAISALIIETLRPDTWTSCPPPEEIIAVFRRKGGQNKSLRDIRHKLFQLQNRYEITIPVWLELELLGVVEQWALGADWLELCENTSLDEGDLVRILRRTVDMLWQIPQVPGISPNLYLNAREAIAAMKRFPVL